MRLAEPHLVCGSPLARLDERCCIKKKPLPKQHVDDGWWHRTRPAPPCKTKVSHGLLQELPRLLFLPIKRFMTCEPGDIRMSEVGTLLCDYRRPAGVLARSQAHAPQLTAEPKQE